MNILEFILNIIIIISEVLYYSIFMMYAKKEGKLTKYFLLFSLISLIFCFISHNNLESYLALAIMMLLGIKYIVKVKTSLYDLLLILIMLFLKILIETPLYMLYTPILSKYVTALIVSATKIPAIILLENKLNKMNKFLHNKWENNNFYIRYIFSILVFIYCIVTVILFLVLPR